MLPLTLDKLSLLHNSGSVTSVRLSGQGGAFVVHIKLLTDEECSLVTSRSKQPRRFTSSDAAISALARIGIAVTAIDTTNWNPADRIKERGNPGRSAALRETHRAAAAAQIQEV